MILYKGKVLFAVPRNYNSGDIEFNIYDYEGSLIGTNIVGMVRNTYFTKQEEIREFEEFIQDLTLDLEIKLKFLMEYEIEIKDWKLIKRCKEDIISFMQKKCKISKNILDKYLKD